MKVGQTSPWIRSENSNEKVAHPWSDLKQYTGSMRLRIGFKLGPALDNGIRELDKFPEQKLAHVRPSQSTDRIPVDEQ